MACLGFLALIGVNGSAHAENATYQTRVKPALQMTLPANSINLTVDPSNQPFDSTDFNISVATNSDAGYRMTMSSESTSLARLGDDANTLSTLSANESGYTQDTFEANKWGYKIGAGNYIPFVSGDEIAHTDTTTNGDVTNLNFAAKVNYLQAAGTYHAVLEFFAVANIVINYIQDLDSNFCTTVGPTTVVDIRDNEEYTVQRLADGNCWMLDNLRLDPTQVSLGDLKGNTNASDETLTYFKNGGGSEPYAVDGVSTQWPNDRYESPYVVTTYKDYLPSDMSTMWGTTVAPSGAASNKIGVYYNLCAASAGSYCSPAGNHFGDVKSDICPSGWRLPIGGKTDSNTNEFNNLYLAYNSNPTDFVNALSISQTGRMLGGTPESGGGMSYFWASSFAYNLGNHVYGMSTYINPYSNTVERVSTNETIYRDYGHAVRCVRDTHTIDDITYMQDIRSTVIRNTAVNISKTLIDKRDNEEYLVSKLADGNLWMLDNLRLDIAALSRDDLEKDTNTTYSNIYCLKTGSCRGDQYNTSPPIAKTEDSGSWEDSYKKPYIATGYKDTVVAGAPGSGSGKAGIFYNYCAASVGSYCYDQDAGTGDAIYDICPLNWRLPKGGSTDSSTNEFLNLFTAQGLSLDGGIAYGPDAVTYNTILSIPLAGYFYGGYLDDQGTNTYLWTSTINNQYDNNKMYVLGVGSNYHYFGNGSNRSNGIPIRCVSTF